MKFKKIISAISAAVIAVSALSVSAVPVSAADDTDSWKAAYSKYLKKLKKQTEETDEYLRYMYRCFSLYDLDGNNIPELIISKEKYDDESHKITDIYYGIYTYSEGKIKLVGNTPYISWNNVWKHSLYFDTESGILICKTSNDAYYLGDYEYETYSLYQYKMSGGKLKKLYSDEKIFYTESEKETFKVNGKKASEKLYKKSNAEHNPAKCVWLDPPFSLTDTDIECAFADSKNYKDVYKKFLMGRHSNTQGEWTNFGKDITGDNIPELFMSYPLYDYAVFTFEDGRLKFMGNVKSGIPVFCRSGKTVGFISSGKWSSNNFYTVKDGYLIRSAELGKDYHYGKKKYTYKYNGIEISKSKYNTLLKKYQKMKFVAMIKDYEDYIDTDEEVNAI